MTDPLTKLAAFTPEAPNRDELLFAAGKASARGGRRWQWATGLLAVTQAVTLGVLLWPHGEVAPPPVPVAPAPVGTPELPTESDPPSPPAPHSYLALLHRGEMPDPQERFAPGPIRQAPP